MKKTEKPVIKFTADGIPIDVVPDKPYRKPWTKYHRKSHGQRWKGGPPLKVFDRWLNERIAEGWAAEDRRIAEEKKKAA